MADLVTLTFKATQERANDILREMGRHDVTRTHIILTALDALLPLAEECPAILHADRKRLEEVMRKVGKILVTLGYF